VGYGVEREAMDPWDLVTPFATIVHTCFACWGNRRGGRRGEGWVVGVVVVVVVIVLCTPPPPCTSSSSGRRRRRSRS